MAESKRHELTLENRKELTVTGVEHVLSYDEREICLKTVMGGLTLKGEGLSVKQLNLDAGELIVAGETFDNLIYGDLEGKSKAIWQRLWK